MKTKEKMKNKDIKADFTVEELEDRLESTAFPTSPTVTEGPALMGGCGGGCCHDGGSGGGGGIIHTAVEVVIDGGASGGGGCACGGGGCFMGELGHQDVGL